MAEASSQASDARDVEEVAEILHERDIQAFVRGDWSTVAQDFTPEPFVSNKCGEYHDASWEIGYSNLGLSMGDLAGFSQRPSLGKEQISLSVSLPSESSPSGTQKGDKVHD